MRIKTIRYTLDEAYDFDKEVNAALQAGWILTERKVIVSGDQPWLYAELEDYDEGEHIDSPLSDLFREAARFLQASAQFMEWRH